MSNSDTSRHALPLGVGSLLASTFGVFMRRFFLMFSVGFLAYLFLMLASFMLFPNGQEAVQEPLLTIYNIVHAILNLIVISLAMAVLVQIAYDDGRTHNNRISDYVRNAFPVLIPLILMQIVMTLMMAVGLIALIVGAFWVAVVFCVYFPTAVIERIGFQSLGRSMRLTKGYRWPILGFILLFILIIFLIYMAISFVFLMTGFGLNTGIGFGMIDGLLTSDGIDPLRLSLFAIVLCAMASIPLGISTTGITLVYARLREIKEGA